MLIWQLREEEKWIVGKQQNLRSRDFQTWETSKKNSILKHLNQNYPQNYFTYRFSWFAFARLTGFRFFSNSFQVAVWRCRITTNYNSTQSFFSSVFRSFKITTKIKIKWKFTTFIIFQMVHLKNKSRSEQRVIHWIKINNLL